MVAFLDFECPFCGRAHETLVEMLDEYGPDKLRLIVKHAPLPFHQRGLPAARATQAVYDLAGSEVFLAYVKRLFEHPDALSDASLLAWAVELGVSAPDFQAQVASATVQDKVKEDLKLAETVGVNGVPAFYINGAPILGAMPKGDFVAIVEHELRAGEELVRRGVAPNAVFAERVAVNWASQPTEPPPFEDVAYQVPIGSSPVTGPKTAAITIVEFADFECPFCEQAHATVANLMTKYPNQIRWVMKHNPLPFHPLAVPAALTAMAVRRRAGDAAYWEALTRLYAADALSEDLLNEVARDFGVPSDELAATWANEQPPIELQSDQDLAMDLNAMGTPHFFINGRRMAGAQPISVFERVIEQELQKVAALGSAPEPYSALQQSALAPLSVTRREVPPAIDSPTLGDVKAKVVIQMFADFECGYCIRVIPTLAALRARYPGQIRLVWRQLPLPFHQHARQAAAAALEARAQMGERGFWLMAERLMGMPNAFLGTGKVALPGKATDLSSQALSETAQELGLDEGRFGKALEQGIHDPSIAADEQVARSLGVHGTPAFFVGPYGLDGAQPLERFDRLVRLVLAESK